MGDLETLEAVAGFGLFADNIEDGVDKLGTLSVVTLSPVVTGTGLTKDKVIGTEQLAIGASTDGVHGAGLQVDKDGAGDILAAGGLVVVDVDALQLKIGVTLVGTRVINAVFPGNHLPELGTNLDCPIKNNNNANPTANYTQFTYQGVSNEGR